jgi:hypothetical protein
MQILEWKSAVLCVRVEDELVILDSASDISLAWEEALIDVQDSYEKVPVTHLEGQIIVHKEGEFTLASCWRFSPGTCRDGGATHERGRCSLWHRCD